MGVERYARWTFETPGYFTDFMTQIREIVDTYDAARKTRDVHPDVLAVRMSVHPSVALNEWIMRHAVRRVRGGTADRDKQCCKAKGNVTNHP
jgi:hypothetical protein